MNRRLVGHYARASAGLAVSLAVVAVLAVGLAGSIALDQAQQLWGGDAE